MALNDLIRQGVALADQQTQALQPKVLHEAWLGSDGFGGASYAPGVERPALVERSNELVRDAQGNEVRAEHTISLLRPLPPNGASGRNEPIDTRDRFTIPDGTTGPVVTVKTFVDPEIGAGYYHIIKLGANR